MTAKEVMNDKRTPEQIEEDFRHREFGKCETCGKWLKCDDKFIDVAEGVCGSSQGLPCTYVDASVRYHVKCYNKKGK